MMQEITCSDDFIYPTRGSLCEQLALHNYNQQTGTRRQKQRGKQNRMTIKSNRIKQDGKELRTIRNR